MASAGGFVPDMERRNVMNLVLVAGAALPVGWLGGGFIYFLVPPGAGGGGGGLLAKDALGNEVNVAKWIKDVPYPSRKLVEGLKGDAHYLIVKQDNTLADFAINAVCTHLGCVVPWNIAALKYQCPCHGSQYDSNGKVVRGPAPLSLALAHCDDEGGVSLRPWTEEDFRTGDKPWCAAPARRARPATPPARQPALGPRRQRATLIGRAPLPACAGLTARARLDVQVEVNSTCISSGR